MSLSKTTADSLLARIAQLVEAVHDATEADYEGTPDEQYATQDYAKVLSADLHQYIEQLTDPEEPLS